MPSAESPQRTIGMVIFPGLTQLDLTGPWEVFVRLPRTKVSLVAETTTPIISEGGLKIMPDMAFDDAPQFDLIFVPGGTGINPMMTDAALMSFLQKQAQQAKYITSVCTGALLLGAAGLLRGKRATTHWLSMDLLGIFGAVPVYQRVVTDGNLITGGGITSGIDFGLTVAAELEGQAAAEKIQLMMEYNPQPPFNSGSPDQADPSLVQKIRADRTHIQQERETLARLVAEQFMPE